MEIVIEIIGYMAAFCIITNMFPQIFKSIKTKKTEDISNGMLFLVLLGSLLWLIYGILTWNFPIIFSDGLSLIFTFVLVYIKITFKEMKGGEIKWKHAK